MLILESSSLDVYRNLAVEEYLMERSTEPVLMLWRSDCAVVVGKNQNPWRECRLERMRNDGVPLARRISGGGTVYHDIGNLNYCVVVDRMAYRAELAYEMVIQALETLGVRAEKTGKSNLAVKGLKFSGNAFCFRKGRALHHGTLLLDTDLERLARYLGPSLNAIETRAIRSAPAEVANLGLDHAAVAAALKARFKTLYGKDGEPSTLPEPAPSPAALEKQRSADWLYGATPKFTVDIHNLHLEVERGRVIAARGPQAERFLDTPFSESALSLPPEY